MSLAKTFTSAIVREIGRNYGKAVSNSLMGDSHSTPVRMVGGSLSRMRGRVYRNAFDEAVTKFSIKGAAATFNQALNVHSEYFTLVEEAKTDGAQQEYCSFTVETRRKLRFLHFLRKWFMQRCRLTWIIFRFPRSR